MTMDELPELPFEKVLSYLSLEDVIKSGAVSRTWKLKTDNYRVKVLCFSDRPRDFIFGKSRLVSGAFAQNFISSTRFASFFNTFGRSILSNLKRLRLCRVRLREEDGTFCGSEFKLSLPMLKSIHIEHFYGIIQLTLDTPRLQEMRLDDSLRRLDLVHVESVERVTIYRFDQIAVKQLKNLKQLYFSSYSGRMDPTLLSGLEKLKEVHLNERLDAIEMLEQRRRYSRTDLKLYLYGLLLNGPEDPEMSIDFKNYCEERFIHLVENQSRLANEIPFHLSFHHYPTIEDVAPEAAINVLKRCSHLNPVLVKEPVQDIERFLDFLKNLEDKITTLWFKGAHPQELFDRLPEHCTVQRLSIYPLPPDHQFLFRLKHLMYLDTGLIEMESLESVRRILEELEFILGFSFNAKRKRIKIDIDKQKLFGVSVEIVWGSSSKVLPNVNITAAIEFIVESIRSGH